MDWKQADPRSTKSFHAHIYDYSRLAIAYISTYSILQAINSPQISFGPILSGLISPLKHTPFRIRQKKPYGNIKTLYPLTYTLQTAYSSPFLSPPKLLISTYLSLP